LIAMIGLSLIGADVGLIAGNKYSTFVAANPVTTTVDGKSFAEVDPHTLSVVTTMNADSGQISHIALAAAVILMIVVITRLFPGIHQPDRGADLDCSGQPDRLADEPPALPGRGDGEVVRHFPALPFRTA
jgi:hypothetical protein